MANFNDLEAGMCLHGHQGSSSCVEVADSSAYYRADVSVLLFNISKAYKHEYIEIYCSADYSADVPILGFDIYLEFIDDIWKCTKIHLHISPSLLSCRCA